ncbi:MAG TPA: NADH-quinone oxidoreductase subunit L [Phycisphaerae bacterium]|nr:NADH-quinone oxidoreductase subunit L [Phycisphaerae bacterium]
MSWYEQFLVIGTLLPLVSFVLLVFFGHRLGKPNSGWFAVAGMGISCVLATIVLAGWHGLDPAEQAELQAGAYRFEWASMGDMPITLGVKLDSLTVIMFFMVTFVSFWIFVFSIGYMSGHSDEIDGQSKYHRFFTFLSLFGFSMLGLTVSSSLLFLFVFWELVGLCSYFLIGFYFDKKFASDAGIKAFVVNRVGDFGFLFGLMMVFTFLGTLDLDQAAREFAFQYEAGSGVFGTTINLFGWEVSGMTLATLMGIGLFCGAIGKSAQFPLHVWLPDAMAGPTPVSALIHAATMVAAGVYLVARVFRLLTPDAQLFVAVIGCITLTMTALIAIVQTDIKKVLAYSTLSQLGYMIFGLGVGAWVAALFHLMTHAFFKAMLFLGSGQVIEGCHHEQEITKMGGLRKKMPFTCWTFFVGVLAIAGAGIPWTSLGLGGFHSKDEILAVALQRTDYWPPEGVEAHHAAAPVDDGASYLLVSGSNQEGGGQAHGQPGHGEAQPGDQGQARHAIPPDAHTADQAAGAHGVDQHSLLALASGTKKLPRWMFWLPVIIAYVTPFYMMRVWWLTFMGKPRDEHVYEHAHEMKLMYVPLIVLAVGTAFASYWIFRPMLASAAPAATDATLIVGIDGHATDAGHAAGLMMPHAVHSNLAPIVGFAFVVGFVAAWLIYRNGLALATQISRMPVIGFFHRILVQKLYFDHVYNFVWVRGCQGFAWLCRLFDTYVIDLFFNLAAKITERFSAFSGWILDAEGVDGVVNGVADSMLKLGDTVRRPQTGRIRNYVLFAAGSAAVILLGILIGVRL